MTKIELIGVENSPGGVLLFVPRKDLSFWADTFIPLATLLIFMFFAFKIHWNNRGIEQGWRYYVILAIFSAPVLGFTYLTLQIHNSQHLQLKRIPYTLYNSTLRMQPEWGIYSKDFEQSFSIVVDTGDEAINAIQVTLKFDPQAIDVKNIDTSNSVCSYFLEQNIHQKEGEIDISCVIINSKGEHGTLPVANIVVVPKQTGTFSLSFNESNTHVFASDGLVTDVLRATQGGSYRVDNFDSALLGVSGESNKKSRSFVVFSTTHSNQDRWYSSKTAHFLWIGRPDQVYVYSFNTSPDTVPSHDNAIQGTSVDIPIIGTGVFYFHLQLASGGPIAHYRVQSDQTPPTITSMDLSSSNIKAGDIVRLSFQAEDSSAGIGKNYYVDLGDHLFLPIGFQLFVPFLESGDRDITLRVYDKAGNYSEKTTTVHVGPKEGN